jgi:hypothetical protein
MKAFVPMNNSPDPGQGWTGLNLEALLFSSQMKENKNGNSR